jgi:hypothetical protein
MNSTTPSFKPMPRWLLLTFRVLCVVVGMMFLVGFAARISLAPTSPWTYVGVVVVGSIAGWLLRIFWHLDRHDREQQMFWEKERKRADL